MRTVRLGLALGGGSARGMAHVGAIDVLEREGIRIDCIAGTSAGALVGAAYAAGVRGQRLVEAAQAMRWRRIARPTWPGRGIVSFARLDAYLAAELGDCTFADLALPYAAVAADLLTGEAVILREGRLAPAVRASCSVPGIVPPVRLNGRLLVDGAICNNLPISVVRALGADLVVAVGLSNPPRHVPRGPLATLVAAMDVLLLRAGDPPATADVYLPIPVEGPGSLLRLSRTRDLVQLGREAALKALPAIREALARGPVAFSGHGAPV
jgi:NTE family protein